MKAIRLLVFILIFCISSLRADNPSASSRFDFDFDAPATAPVLGRAIASAGGAVGAAAGAAVPTSRPGLEPQPCSPKPICPSTPRTSYAQDGTCNNLVDGGRGSVDRPFRRLLPPAYADRTGSPRVASNGGELPSPRLVSTTMAGSMTSSSSASSVLPFWGQYIVHDIANTPTIIRVPGVNCRCDRPDPDCINIEIPRTDVQFTQDRRTCLPVVRSHPVQDAHCNPNIRQQKNEITSYLDAGNVYGNSQSAFDDMINQNSAVGELK
uniref:Peroxidase n=1 Tax=Ciona savignyi TaxID=51511 RepID=H2ZPC2_CIOSA